MNNLRPISLLPLQGKILEKLIHVRLMKHLENNNFLTNVQGGFRPKHSTAQTTSKLTDDMFDNMNNKKVTYVLLIDFKKAFDTINHKILVKELSKIGLHHNAVKLLTSYPSNRAQRTLVNNSLSDIKSLNFGVPQGSILGPLLFLIFINDLPQIINHSNLRLYADDTALYCAHENPVIAQHWFQTDLDALVLGCKRNQLTINTNKTKRMTFGTKQMINRSPVLNFTIDDYPIECVILQIPWHQP